MGVDEAVECGDESLEVGGELDPFLRVEGFHDGAKCIETSCVCLGVASPASVGDRHHDHTLVLGIRTTSCETDTLQSLDGAGRGGGIDSECFGQIPHAPGVLLNEHVEGVHLATFECVVAGAEEVFDESAHRSTASNVAPGSTDTLTDLALCRIVEVDRRRAGGRHGFCRVQAVEPPLHALNVIATQTAMITPTLRHVEMFTMRGMVSLLWHQVPAGQARKPAAIVACGGAMGGLLGPADGLYQALGDSWSQRGVSVARVSYRRPNDLDACCLDVAAAVQLVADAGAERVVVMGHSFGGAVAVRVGVAMDEVAGVVTFATQSAGCEVAPGLRGKPLLLFHGDADEILPIESSHMVAAMAGAGDVVVCEGDGHLLAHSASSMSSRLEEWLPNVLAV